MDVIDPGHDYILDTLDSDLHREFLRFVKRSGPGYPGNKGHHSGTNIQEVVRVLIDRVKYLDNQIPCEENKHVLFNLRSVIFWLERRAAIRHGRNLSVDLSLDNIEDLPSCPKCGHIECKQHGN